MIPSLPVFTGTQVKYFAFCHRRLWLFTHGVEMERENEDVQLGTTLGEKSYERERKEVNIDDKIVLDWTEHKLEDDGTLTLHEVKKSKSFDQAHRLQVLYYLYYLKHKGVTARGVIDYPLLKKTESVELTPEAESEVHRVLDGVKSVVEMPQAPPRLDNKRLCEKCAYFELCWS